MGFLRYKNGPILPCRMINGVLQTTLPSGKVLEFKTGLQLTIPEQTIPFESPSVMFCLDFEGKTYIGRDDKSISVYCPWESGRLHGLSNWEAPFYPIMPVVGFVAVADRVEEIYLDLVDKRTLYHGQKGEYYVLPEPILPIDLQADYNKCLSTVQANNNQIASLVMQNGKEVISNVLWSMAPSSRSRDRRRLV